MLVGVLIMLGGWNLTQTFSLSTTQAVVEDKVAKLERQIEKLQDKMDIMMNSDEEIMEQHRKLFEALEDNNQPRDGGGYNY